MTAQELQAQRAQLLQEISERDRKQTIESPEARLERVDQQLTALELERQRAAFERAVEINDGLKAANQAAIARMVSALDALDLPAALDASRAVMVTFQQQQAHAIATIAAAPLLVEEAYRPLGDRFADETIAARQASGALLARLANAWPVNVALTYWAATSKAVPDHVRQGLAWAASDPDRPLVIIDLKADYLKGYDPQREADRRVSQAYRWSHL